MESDNKVDLSSVNKVRSGKSSTKGSLTRFFKKKSAGRGRDEVGRFVSGSGGLLGKKKIDLKRSLPVILVIALVGGFLVYRSFAATALLGNDGEFLPITPARLYDTRLDGPKTQVPANGSINIQATGRIGIPSGARAVVAYVTAVDPTATGYTRVGAAGTTLTTTQQNYTAGQRVTNQVTIPLSSSGQMKLTSTARSHFVVDVAGFISSEAGPDGLRYSKVTEERIFDTRNDGTKLPVAANGSVTFDISKEGLFNQRIPYQAQSVVLSLTAVSPTSAGYARMWPSGQTGSPITLLNFSQNQGMTGTVIVPVDAARKLTLSSTAQSHFAIDILGYYEPEGYIGDSVTQEGRFEATPATRVLDTRQDSRGTIKAGEKRYFSTYAAEQAANAEYGDMPVISITSLNSKASGYARVGQNDSLGGTKLTFTQGQRTTNQFVLDKNGTGEGGLTTGDSVIWSSKESDYVVDVVGFIRTGRYTGYNFMETYVNYNSDDWYAKEAKSLSYVYKPVSTESFRAVYVHAGFSFRTVDGGWHSTGRGIGLTKTGFASNYCYEANSCELLLPNSSTNDWSVTLPYSFQAGQSYTIEYTALDSHPEGKPGAWIQVSVTNGSRKTDVMRFNVYETDRELTEGMLSNRLQLSVQSSRYRDSCNERGKRNTSLFTDATVDDMRADGTLIKVDELRNANYIEEIPANECPGDNRIDTVVSGSGQNVSYGFRMMNNIPRALRDIEKPKLSSPGVTYDTAGFGGRGLTFTATDNHGIAKSRLQYLVDGEYRYAQEWYGENNPVNPKLITERLQLSWWKFDEPSNQLIYGDLPSGNHQVRVHLYDTSGNHSTVDQTVTIP
jgi:starvation-inducible outer membrane lipoprotein